MASTLALLVSDSLLDLSTDELLDEQRIPALAALGAQSIEPTNSSFAGLALEPDELINAVLPQVLLSVDEAGNAWSEDEFGDACTHLEEAFSLLQELSVAVLPEPTGPTERVEALSPFEGDVADARAEADWSQFLAVAA